MQHPDNTLAKHKCETYVLDIWDRGICTASICDCRRAIDPAAAKERRPARADAINQRGGQGKPRRVYLDDSQDHSVAHVL
jgi:hypothetical protein